MRGAEASTVSDDVQFLMAAEKGNADVILLLLKKQIPITTRDRDTQVWILFVSCIFVYFFFLLKHMEFTENSFAFGSKRRSCYRRFFIG